MMPRPYTQTFPNHGLQILDQLNVQRYYGNFCDVVVRVEDADFKLHKCVLAASSSKLQALMYSIHQDSTDVLSLKDLTMNGFKVVVEYMYTGILRLDAVSVQEVLIASQHLELRDVEKACLEFYKSTGAEAPLPPLEAALGLVRMSGLGGAPPGLHYQVMQQSVHLQGSPHGGPPQPEPTMVILPGAHHGNQDDAQGQAHQQGQGHGTAPSAAAETNAVNVMPQSPQATQMQPIQAAVNPPPPSPRTQSSALGQQTYGVPNHSIPIDTNYIEDYLKIIESIQGEQNPPQLEPQVGVPPAQHQSVTSVTTQEPPALVAATKPAATLHGAATPQPMPDYKDARLQPGIGQMSLQEGHSVGMPNPPVAVVNPRTTTSVAPPTGNPGTSSSNSYSPEEVRRTILSVLSQEKFDDDEDECEKEKDPVPLTSLLNIQPLGKRAGTPTPRGTLPPISDDGIDEVPLDMHMGAMDPSSDSEPDPTETISEMSSDRDELHIHIPETPPEVASSAQLQCLPLPPAPPPQSAQHTQQLDVPIVDPLDQAQHSPEPKTGGPLILRIKRKQRKGQVFDFGDFESMSTPVPATADSAVDVIPWKREANDPASEWSTSTANMEGVTVSAVPAERSTQYAQTSMALPDQSAQNSCNSYGPHITDGEKSYIQMKPPEQLPYMSTMQPNPVEPERVSTCPKPFKKRLPNRSKPPVRKPNLACEKCGREFDKVDSLNKHLELHDTDTNSMVYSCHVCGFKYNRPGELTRHMRKHSADSFTCNLCSAEFREPRLFRRHMQSIHDVTKPFTCSYPGCSFSADKLSHVEKHRTIHSGVKAFECPKCSKGFCQVNGLRSHLKSCFQRRGYECRTCGQKFNHLQSMKSHILLHSGEKPHCCEDCGAKFADHRNFKRHRRIHDNSYPYSCGECNKKFRHSNSLKAHMNVHLKNNAFANAAVTPSASLSTPSAVVAKREGESGVVGYAALGQTVQAAQDHAADKGPPKL